MEERFVIIGGISYPLNLKILMEENWENPTDDFHLMDVYYLALNDKAPDGKSFNIAIITETRQIIFSTDKDLIRKIWEKLSPEKSKIIQSYFIVYNNQKAGYLLPYYEDDVYPLIDEEEYNSLVGEKENPFSWLYNGLTNELTSSHPLVNVFIEDINKSSSKN